MTAPVFVHGRFANIQIGDASQTLYDLSPVANSAEAPVSIDTAETSHFGTTAKEYIIGLNDATVSISGQFDATIDGKISATVDALCNGTIMNIPVQWAPAGTATGNPKYTFNAIITSYAATAPVGGVVTIKLELQRTGPQTRATF